MTTDWYRWPTEEAAQTALDSLNNNPALPLVISPDKQALTCWAEGVSSCLDGKYAFARLPQSLIAYFGATDEEQAAWLQAYVTDAGGTIEPYNPDWFEE